MKILTNDLDKRLNAVVKIVNFKQLEVCQNVYSQFNEG